MSGKLVAARNRLRRKAFSFDYLICPGAKLIHHDRTMAPAILRPSRNVWRIEHAARAAVLIDGAALFRAVREAMIQARHSIVIIGWDIDSRTRLVGESGRADDGFPIRLVDFLRALVARRPKLVIHLLLWNYSVLYALEREFLPRISLDWSTPNQVRLCLDNEVPLGSSQHQKIVVVDDSVAFSGGLDLTIRRWDTPDHTLENPRRIDPSGIPYRPFHDVQAVVDGDAARALAALARERWRRADCTDPASAEEQTDCWPQSVQPDFTNVEVGIARTQPAYNGLPEVREVENLFLDSIDAAERMIYVENQFLTAEIIAERIAAQLRRRRNLEAIFVAPSNHQSWIESRTMRNGRIRFRRIIEGAGVADRFRLVYPEVHQHGRVVDTMIHSKVMAVDDKFLRIGSANMNNRSMGADTECDLAIEAENAAQRETIAYIRNRLLGEHCGATAEDVAAILAKTGSLVAVPDRLSSNGHLLRSINDGEPDDDEITAYIEEIADPPQPLASRGLMQMAGERLQQWRESKVFKLTMVGLLLLALTLAWRLTPLSDYSEPEIVREGLANFRDSAWAPLIVLAVFLAGGLIAFPLTIMIAATAAAFGPWLGIVYAATSALASALLTYGIGRVLGREALQHLLGKRLNRIRARIARQGVFAVAAIRLVPIAPFTLVNLAAGASEIRLVDYAAGTLLGLAPGLVVLAVLGHQVFRMLNEPSALELAIAAVCIAAWIAVTFAVQALILKFGDRNP